MIQESLAGVGGGRSSRDRGLWGQGALLKRISPGVSEAPGEGCLRQVPVNGEGLEWGRGRRRGAHIRETRPWRSKLGFKDDREVLSLEL